MALTTSRAIVIPPGYKRRTRFYNEISESSEPALELYPAQYLPVVDVDYKHNVPFVLYAGVIVANSTMALQGGYITYANGGTAAAITYAAQDVYDADNPERTYQVEDINSLTNIVTAAGLSATEDAANLPVGYMQHPCYSDVYRVRALNFQMQDVVTITCDKFIEIPIRTADQKGTGVVGRGLASGCLVVPMPASLGVSVRYVAADSVDPIIVRVIRVETVASAGGRDKVFTTKGLSLPGVDTNGIASHLDHTGTTTSAKINITLA